MPPWYAAHAWAVLRQPRPRTYTYDTVKVLPCVWLVAGQPCGKYLGLVVAATLEKMDNQPDSMRFGEETDALDPPSTPGCWL